MALKPPPPPLHVSSRPMLVAAVALSVGIVLADFAPNIPAFLWAGAALAAAAFATTYVRATQKRIVTLRPLALGATLVIGLIGIGAARTSSWLNLPPDHVGHVAAQAPADEPEPGSGDQRLTVWATLVDTPKSSSNAVRFIVETDSARRGTVHAPLRGRIQVSLGLPRDADVLPVYPTLRLGDRVRLNGLVEPPSERRNPAQMDYAAFLRGRGIHATMWIEDEAAILFLGPATSLLDRITVSTQRHIRDAISSHVPDAGARAALLALLLADRSEIDPETLDSFRATGLMHLLAVSGLHVLLVGLGLYGLLKPLLGRIGLKRRTVEWTRTMVTIALLGLYVLVTGASVSVVRAFVMATILIVGRAAERRVDTLNSLGFAAIVLLLIRPTALFDVGFQLSFSAVAALVTLGPVFSGWLPDRWQIRGVSKYLTGSVVASTAATLGTGPVLLATFGILPLAGLVLNIPAIPLTAFTLGGGLGTVLTDGWLNPVAKLFGAFASMCARGLFAVSEEGARGLGWATLEGFVTSPITLLALALGLATLAMWRRPDGRRRLALAALASLAFGLWSGFVRHESAPRLDIVFLDVGQGDATLIRLPNGKHVLIDAGIRSPYVDHGERTVLPHLKRYGVDRIDAFILTHADADHIGGAASVLADVPVGRLIHNGQRGATDLWADVFAAADSMSVRTERAVAGDSLALDPTVRIRILGPSDGIVRGGDANEASVVVLIQYGNTTAILTGDAEHAGEADLVKRYGRTLHADVVKVGHHGSRTSSTPAFVAAVASAPVGSATRRTSTGAPANGPQYAVVSVAERNRYGLPNDEPLARWAGTGASVLQTAQEGAVWLRSDGRAYGRVDWR